MRPLQTSLQALGAIIFLMVVCCTPALAVPVIDYSTPGQFSHIEHSASTTFSVTCTENVTWEWYVDGTDRNVNLASLAVSFTEPGQHNVTVTATNINGVDSYTFFPYVAREGATGETEIIEDTGYDELMDSIGDNDFEAFFGAVSMPAIAIMGGFYYVFIVGLPFFMIWNRQQSLLIPSVVALIVGAVLLPMVPEPYVKFLQLCVVLGSAAVIWSVYKDR